MRIRLLMTLLSLAAPVMTAEAASIFDYVSKTYVKDGEWTSDLQGVRKRVLDEGRGFYLIEWGQAGGGCGNCNGAARSIWNRQEFLDWSAAYRIPIVEADYDIQDYAAKQVQSLYSSNPNEYAAFPVVTVVDGRGDAMNRIGWFYPALSTIQSGGGSSSPVSNPWGLYVSELTPAMVSNLVSFCIGQIDDKPYSATTVGKNRQLNKTAREIIPDDKNAKQLFINGVCKDYGWNRLTSTNYWVGSTLKSYYYDTHNFITFKNKTLGTSYKMTLPFLDDEKDEGRFSVYKSLDDAKKAAEDPAVGEKLAIFTTNLATMANGVSFTPQTTGDVYCQFWCRTPKEIDYVIKGKTKRANEEINILYTFTLQEEESVAYYFSAGTATVAESAAGIPVTVKRTISVGAGKTTLRGPSGFEQEVAFRDGSTTATVTVPFASVGVTPKIGLWTGPVTVSFTVDSEAKPPAEAATKLTATVTDVDAALDAADPADDERSGATALTATVTARLNDTDVCDWYVLTLEPGRRYAVKPTLTTTNGIDRISVSLFVGEATEALTQAEVKVGDEPVELVCGSDVATTAAIKVSRAAGQAPVTAIYGLAVTSTAMPVIAFEKTALTVDSPIAATNATFVVTMTGTPVSTTVFGLEVKGVASGTAVAAEADVDFALIDESRELTANGAVVTVDLPEEPACRPERRFDLTLLPADFKTNFYLLGAGTNVAVTVKGTVAGNAEGATPETALQLDLAGLKDGETWVTTGETVRNLSGATTNDWIAIAGIEGGERFYRLTAEVPCAKPELASDSATVTVMTNGTEVVGTFALADLVGAAPTLAFEPLADKTVVLCVSRPADETVKLEYVLSLREWTKPTLGFTTPAVAVPDWTPTFTVALERTGNTTDEQTLAVAFENLSTAAGEGYCTADETVTFAAGEATAEIHVTVTDPDWNLTHWTGDRAFRLTLAEDPDDGAVAFTENKSVEVTLLDCDKQNVPTAALDAADAYDATREGTTGHEVAIADDGTVGLVSGSLNGFNGIVKPATEKIDDTTDWIHFTDLKAGERYMLALDVDATNTTVTATFFVGDATTGTDITTELVESGYCYNATSGDDVFVRLTRTPAETVVATASYKLKAWRYVWPTVSFASDKVTVDNDKTSVALVINRIGAEDLAVTNLEVRVSATGWAAGICTNTTVTLNVPRNETEATATLDLVPPATGVWVGDWTFTADLVANAEWYRQTDPKTVTVTVRDTVSQYDATDGAQGDDTQAGATPKSFDPQGALTLDGHLNGLDTATGSDLADWFTITGVTPETTCRFTLGDVSGANTNGIVLKVDFVYDGTTVSKTFADLADGFNLPCPTGGDVLVGVSRTGSTAATPVSLAYALTVTSVDWPRYELSAPAVTTNDVTAVVLTVTRADNLEGASSVLVTVTDENDVPVVGETFPCAKTVAFTNGQATAECRIALAAGEAGFWRRGGSFTAALSATDDDPSVTIGSANTVTVDVRDASGLPENDYPADDAKDSAPSYPMDTLVQVATNQVAAGQSLVWLNGGDTTDWYRFTGIQTGRKCRFSLTDLKAAGTNGVAVTATVYQGNETLATKSLFEIGEKWDVVPQTTEDLYLVVSRDEVKTQDVSIAYAIGFRLMAPSTALFACGAVTVSEAAEEVQVEVVCQTEFNAAAGGNEPLDADAVLWVTPVENPDDPFTATAYEDFDPTPIKVVWPAGTTGGVQRVSVPLMNLDARWEGDETFLLELTTDSETEVSDLNDTVVVTITDIQTPVYGTVGVTAIDGRDPATALTIREGAVLPIDFNRIDGLAGAVTSVWTWTVGKVTTTVTNAPLYAERETGAKRLELDVPVTPGYQATQAATLKLALLGKTVGLTKGSVSSFKLTLTDADYAGTVASATSGDVTAVAFRAAGTQWYLDADGAYKAATPAAGSSVIMSTTITGPGQLVFEAKPTDCEGCTIQAKSGATTVDVTAGENRVPVTAGNRTVQIVLTRPKTGAPETATVAISNVRFVPDADFFSIGTFDGAARLTTAEETIPGTMTLTVSTTGAFSGKIQSPDRTWTFSARGGWEDGVKTVTAKSGKLTLTLRLAVALETGVVSVTTTEGSCDVSAELARRPWGDKPLSVAAAEALERAAGYYTMTLPDASGQAAFGSGYLTATVSSAGKVRFSGRLADGQAVSLSTPLVLATDGTPGLDVYAAPRSYQGGWIAQSLMWPTGEDSVLEPIDSDLKANWTSRSQQDPFDRAVTLEGGRYSKLENLYERYTAMTIDSVVLPETVKLSGTDRPVTSWGGSEEFPVSLAFTEDGSALMASVADEPTAFTIRFVRATGLLSGVLRLQADVDGRPVRKSLSYKGVLTPNTKDGAAGRGYLTVDGQSVDITIKEEN